MLLIYLLDDSNVHGAREVGSLKVTVVRYLMVNKVACKGLKVVKPCSQGHFLFTCSLVQTLFFCIGCIV